MSYHFIRHKPNGGLMTVIDGKSKPMYMCFRSRHCAEHCRKHFAQFKSKYGVWPTIDLSTEQNIDVFTPLSTDKMPFSYLYETLTIDTIQEDELIKLGNITGSSMLYCHEFGVLHQGPDKMSVAFSGQEIEFETDFDIYLRGLEEGITD